MGGKRHTIEFVQKTAKSKGGICLSKTYKNSTDKLEFKCAEGHVFEKDFKHILHRNQWCQKCSRNLSEEICRYIFEYLLNVKFEKIKFNYQGHCLELDGYNSDIHIAFEYNGRQHYEITPLIKTESELDYRKYLDKLKVKYCELNGINLIVISYTIKNDELVDYIKDVLKIKNKKNIDINKFINSYSYYKKRKDDIETIINKKGGKLLNFNFDSIEIKCMNNHKWITKYSITKKGHWCKLCASSNRIRKLTNSSVTRKVPDIKSIIKTHGITCLSAENEYINGKSILSFQCRNGHIFKDTVDYLLARITGKNKENNRKPCQLCNRSTQNKALEKISSFCLTLLNPSDYKNKKEEVKWVCKNGHIQKNKLKNLIEKIRRENKCCKLCN